jgi:hypothetical protein
LPFLVLPREPDPKQKRVAFATFYLLDDAQLWFHRMELNGGQPTWPQFVQLVNARFRPPLMDSPLIELAMLQRSGTVDNFSKRFISLSCHDVSLTEAQQIQLFITMLGDPLRTDVTLQQPSSLDDAIIFARAYEQRNASRDTGQPPQARAAGRYSRTASLLASSLAFALTAPGPASS